MEKPRMRLKEYLGRETPPAIILLAVEPSQCHIVYATDDGILTGLRGYISSVALSLQHPGN